MLQMFSTSLHTHTHVHSRSHSHSHDRRALERVLASTLAKLDEVAESEGPILKELFVNRIFSHASELINREGFLSGGSTETEGESEEEIENEEDEEDDNGEEEEENTMMRILGIPMDSKNDLPENLVKKRERSYRSPVNAYRNIVVHSSKRRRVREEEEEEEEENDHEKVSSDEGEEETVSDFETTEETVLEAARSIPLSRPIGPQEVIRNLKQYHEHSPIEAPLQDEIYQADIENVETTRFGRSLLETTIEDEKVDGPELFESENNISHSLFVKEEDPANIFCELEENGEIREKTN